LIYAIGDVSGAHLYLRTLVSKGKFATIEEADDGTPRRTGATRYGKEVAARQRA
jgi:hypothetical protein